MRRVMWYDSNAILSGELVLVNFCIAVLYHHNSATTTFNFTVENLTWVLVPWGITYRQTYSFLSLICFNWGFIFCFPFYFQGHYYTQDCLSLSFRFGDTSVTNSDSSHISSMHNCDMLFGFVSSLGALALSYRIVIRRPPVAGYMILNG